MGGGSKGGGGTVNAGDNRYTRAMGRIADTTFDESTPLRQSITGTIGNIFGLDTSKMFQARDSSGRRIEGQYTQPQMIEGLFGATPQERAAIESQYSQARSGALNNGLRGSSLGRNLTNIDIARAGQVSSLVGAEKQRALNAALGVAYNTPQQAQQGYSSAAGQFTQGLLQQQALEQQQASSKAGGMGSFLGK